MLPRSLVLEVKRLLDDGQLSRRQIAERLRVSRGAVGAIADGRRDHLILAADDEPENDRPLPAERCPGCGALVYMPCVLCRTRRCRRIQRDLLPHYSTPRVA